MPLLLDAPAETLLFTEGNARTRRWGKQKRP